MRTIVNGQIVETVEQTLTKAEARTQLQQLRQARQGVVDRITENRAELTALRTERDAIAAEITELQALIDQLP